LKSLQSDTVSYPRRIETEHTESKKIYGPRRKEICGRRYAHKQYLCDHLLVILGVYKGMGVEFLREKKRYVFDRITTA
jgi:hypothetical protein